MKDLELRELDPLEDIELRDEGLDYSAKNDSSSSFEILEDDEDVDDPSKQIIFDSYAFVPLLPKRKSTKKKLNLRNEKVPSQNSFQNEYMTVLNKASMPII